MTSQPDDPPRWIAGSAAPRGGSHGILRFADYAIKRLRQLGIPFPSPCRLERARSLVATLHDPGSAFPDSTMLAEATRTVFEAYYIARALGDGTTQPDRDLKNRLARMLSGPDIPEDEDENSSRPRNTQFELFVGAWLASGGIWVRHGEPDLLVRIIGEQLGVAAKRIRSRKQLVRRARQASDQIKKSGARGIIALNVDPLLDELPSGTGPSALGPQFDAAVPELEQAISEAACQDHVFGLLALGTQFRWDLSDAPPRLDLGTFVKFRAFIPTGAGQAAFEEFWKDFQRVHAERMGRF